MKRTLLGFAAMVFASTAMAGELDVVRTNFAGYYTAAGASRTSARMQQALAGLEASARDVTAPGHLLADGSWSDVNYNDTPDGSWSPWDHSRRMFVMARAYQTPGQSLYRDPVLLGQITASIRYVQSFYGPTELPLGNWWFWTIGIPLDLGPTLVLMQKDLDAKTLEDATHTLAVHIGNSPAGRGLVGPVPVGQNLVWSSYTHLCLALLRNDEVMLGKVRDAMASVTQTSPADGIKPDRSFHQHGAQLYTGGYGGAFANEAARYALITRGTSFGLPPASLASFADYVADGIAWSLLGNHFDVSVIGREVARETTSGLHGVAALVQSAVFDSPRSAEIRAAAAQVARSWQWALPVELAGLATIVEESNVTPRWPSGHRHYEHSDYTVHRRATWFASIKMFSTRTKSGERTNNENLFGSRQSDGRLFLSLNGQEHFDGQTIPALDWSRLPGITVEQNGHAADATYGYGTRRFAGGTGDGQNGVSAMEVAPLGSALTAKKAWFFFDDAMVFLTNSIQSLSGHRVETVVNQWPLSRADAAVVSDPSGRWVVGDGIGYFFPVPGDLRVERQTRTGTWAALGGSPDRQPRTKTFLTMWIDHGVNPTGASAEYVLVPHATPASMAAMSANPPFAILTNNGVVSAVRDRRTNATGVVFWTAASFDGMQSDAPAIVYLTDDGARMQLTVADPNAGNGTIRLTLPGRYSTSNGRATTVLNTTTIEIPSAGGKTFRTTLTRLPPVRRRASR